MKINKFRLLAVFLLVVSLNLNWPSYGGSFPIVDSSFGSKGTVMLKGIHGTTGALTSNGDLLIHGYSTGLNSSLAILKLSSKGKLDTSYGAKGVSNIKIGNLKNNSVPQVFLNLILDKNDAAFGFTADGSLGEKGSGLIAKINNNGKLDTSFGQKGFFRFAVPDYDYTIFMNGSLDSAGNIIAVGGAQKLGWENPANPRRICNYEALIAKVDSKGELVSGFKNLGYTIFPFTNQNGLGNTCIMLEAVNVDKSDNIYIAHSISTGSSQFFGIYIAKMDSNGNLIKDFGTNGVARIFTSDNRYEIGIKEILIKDDKIYLAGKKLRATPNKIGIGSPNSSKTPPEYIYDSMLLRINSNGSIDETFGTKGFYVNSDSPKNNEINNIFIQDSGDIYLGGADTTASGKSVGSISKLNSSGILDSSFGNKGIYLFKYNSNNYITRSSTFTKNGSMYGISIAENCNNCETHVKKFKLN